MPPSRFEDGSATVGIIGLGYVGLPLLGAFCEAGLQVLGFDNDPQKIRQFEHGENYLNHLGHDFVRRLRDTGRCQVTDDFDRLGEADALLICLPTPLDRHLQPDLSYVEQTSDAIARTLRAGQLIVLESTTYPGTTRELLLPRFERDGLVCGRDFWLAFSPEREDPGSADHSTRTIPKLVGGIDPESGRHAVALYRHAIEHVVPVRTAEVAEAAKLLENIYRAVNIAMVNEMKILLTALGIDVWEVIEAAATKPFGFKAFYPGPGLGGHCIPIDPYYLAWKAREAGLPARFIELAGEVNRSMPDYVVQRTLRALNDCGKAVRGARIMVIGLAYKRDVDDIRESPSFDVIEKLQALGADVCYHDPHVEATHSMRHHDLKMTSTDLSADALEKIDCVLIATDHSACDWQMIADHAPLIVDTRHVMANVNGPKDHVVDA
ncbi:MAG: UDP-N-acetyl-D-glucosamine dehydrogenase [Phycisphaeraceae bacterium]|nr:UDP-N-acetyl-D-glucosamine dehydrogenase [Phycisphaeraceae bacterium]